jgi:hypothetical protein
LPLESLPKNTAEARAVRHLCATILAAGDPPPAYATLLERLRGNEDEAIFREAAADLMQQPFADEDIDAEFDGAIERLAESDHKRAFAILQEKIQKLGVAGLSSEEKQQYLQVLGTRGKAS